MFLRGGLKAMLALPPALAGFVFYLWLEWSPKSWLDPTCGVTDYALLAFLPVFAAPTITSAVWSHRTGKDAAVTVWLALGTLVVTAAACVLGFLVWFGKHKCGE
jgi:hypothetical protein